MGSKFLESFKEYLKGRYLADETIASHIFNVSQFFQFRKNQFQNLEQITIVEIDEFLSIRLKSLSRRTSGIAIASLRHMIRFLYMSQILKHDFSYQLIRPRVYCNEGLPRGIKREAIKTVLKSIDRSSRKGKKGYAIVLLMAVYGLRPSELCNLKLNLFDWHNDKFCVNRLKSNDYLTLPILPEVGNAIIDYLQSGRPSLNHNYLFDFPQKYKVEALRKVIKGHFKNAKITEHVKLSGFRHGAAIAMVSNRIPFKNISDVLGHRCAESTYVYAKCDIENLRQASLPYIFKEK